MDNKRSDIQLTRLSEVSDPTRKLYQASAVAEALKEFVENQFPACADVNVQLEQDGAIMLCADYLALLFKSLLRSVFGNAFLTIDISSDAERLLLSISTDKPTPIPDSEINKLIRIARNTGLEVDEDPSRFTAHVKFISKKEYSVYAINFSRDKKIITSKLCEVFKNE